MKRWLALYVVIAALCAAAVNVGFVLQSQGNKIGFGLSGAGALIALVIAITYAFFSRKQRKSRTREDGR